MTIKMLLDGLLIEQVEIFFDGLNTLSEREDYLKKLSDGLYRKHFKKINLIDREPEFFLDNVQSKGADLSQITLHKIA